MIPSLTMSAKYLRTPILKWNPSKYYHSFINHNHNHNHNHNRITYIHHSFSSSKSKPNTSNQQQKQQTNAFNANMKQFASFTVAAGGAYALVYTYIQYEKDKASEEEQNNINDILDRPVEPQAPITSKVYFDIMIDGIDQGRIIMGLHGTIVPKTVGNFQSLCEGYQLKTSKQHQQQHLSYESSPFHRVIPNFMIQGGDITHQNGYGGMSIYGPKFPDENFVLKHTGKGIVSMANAGPNTNSSQFFICTTKTPHLDGRHTVLGVVLDGWEVVRKIERCGSSSGIPKKKIIIKKSGLIVDEKSTISN